MAEYEKYHGLVLREFATKLTDGVHIKAHDAHGIINCFLINKKVGLFIKHSSSRISPWTFGFTEDHLTELQLLSEDTEISFICLVCGYDGFLILNIDEFSHLAMQKNSDNSFNIHVKRRKRHMYTVGGRDKLERNKSRGISEDMFHALTN